MNEDFSFRIKFIKEVERNPCLYDHNHENYNNKKAIDAVWAHLGQMFKEHGSDCKNKWRSIRSAYIRSVANSSRNSKKYYLAHHLSFLKPFLRFKTRRRESGNLSAPEEDDPNDSYQTDDDLLYIDQDHPLHIQIDPEGPRVKEEHDDTPNDDVNDDSNPLRISEDRNKRRSQFDIVSITPHCSTKKRRLFDNDSDNISSCEHYALSLVPYLERMTERQQLAFRKAVIDLIEKIKYGES